MLVIQTYFTVFRLFFAQFSSKVKPTSIAGKSLFQGHSTRIPNGLSKVKAPFVFIKLGMGSLSRGNHPKGFTNDLNHKTAIYFINEKHVEQNLNYFNEVLNEDFSKFFLEYSNGTRFNIFEKLTFSWFNYTFAFWIILISPFNKNSNKWSLVLGEIVLNIILIKGLKENGVKKLIYPFAFHKDTNLTALLCHKHGIYCHKIPSSNPIKNFYTSVLADKFSFTAPFQQYEYQNLKKNWLVKDFDQFPITTFHVLKSHTVEQKGEAPNFTIGIFTRGMWLRKKKGMPLLGNNEDIAEEQMLEAVKSLIHKQNSGIKKIILLFHPLEKSSLDQYNESKAYYSGFFDFESIEYSPIHVSSPEQFNQFDVGIASISSVIYERLFCGYKSMLAPIQIKGQLFEDEHIQHIVAQTKEEVIQKLEVLMQMTNQTFFRKFELQDYRNSEIKTITNLKK
jgi:hypothetical protein